MGADPDHPGHLLDDAVRDRLRAFARASVDLHTKATDRAGWDAAHRAVCQAVVDLMAARVSAATEPERVAAIKPGDIRLTHFSVDREGFGQLGYEFTATGWQGMFGPEDGEAAPEGDDDGGSDG